MVADNPDNRIDLKTFHSEILNVHETVKMEQDSYENIEVVRKLDNGMMQRN